MSDYQHKPNSGSLFQNDKKEQDTHPDWKGSALIDGQDYWVSLWKGYTKQNQPRMRLSFQPKEQQQHGGGQQQQQTRQEPDW